jgi:hypothetical protein
MVAESGVCCNRLTTLSLCSIGVVDYQWASILCTSQGCHSDPVIDTRLCSGQCNANGTDRADICIVLVHTSWLYNAYVCRTFTRTLAVSK